MWFTTQGSKIPGSMEQKIGTCYLSIKTIWQDVNKTGPDPLSVLDFEHYTNTTTTTYNQLNTEINLNVNFLYFMKVFVLYYSNHTAFARCKLLTTRDYLVFT